jgi:hypothetical protein
MIWESGSYMFLYSCRYFSANNAYICCKKKLVFNNKTISYVGIYK